MRNTYSVGELIYDPIFYDGLHKHHEDLPFYSYWLKQKNPGNILELCCGTGRLTIPLCQEGMRITGVDIDKSMLDEAKTKSAENSLNIPFIESDMRHLKLNQIFDAIFIPFNSIHHLYTNSDLFLTLKSAQDHLDPDGLFIFDCYNPNIQAICDNTHNRIFYANFTTRDGRQVVIDQSMIYESDTQICRIKWHHTIDGSFHSNQSLDMRMYYPQELDSYLKSNGFIIVHKYGDFDYSEFTSSSIKQIFICKKKLSRKRIG
jgi:SAM-dependent methyltransferase